MRLLPILCFALHATWAALTVAQSSRLVTATATAAATAPTGAPPVCVPQFDCSTSPKGCLNNGVCQGNVCKCMPGFGGSDCGLLSCGSPLTDSSQRPTVASGAGCSTCDDGFGGLNCNVCQTNAGCQAKPPSRFSLLGNENLVCNKKPEVFYNAFMACPVRAPELSGLFPGDHMLTVDLNPVNKSIHGQLWLNKAEQFFCNMPDCTLTTTDEEGSITTKWECPVLQCSCVEPSLMCGGIPGPPLSLKGAINGLKGPFMLTCPHNSKNCDFFIDDLKGFFPTGLKLADCDIGECVYPSEMQSSLTAVHSTLAPGVIAGLAILGAIIVLLLVACVLARRSQLALMHLPYTVNTDAASLEFRNVGYTLSKDGLEILKGISGAAPAGVVLAVMGPSGAGKSTLVDILAGKRKDGKVTGQILLNGKQVHESQIRHAVGFVDQEDTLAATQTVYEAVLFSAMLRLPEAMPIQRIHERVAEVIEMLGLTHCKDRRIGNVTSRGISGGEKRRVSIALELITRPPILILDEPTSGLDSYSAHMVVEQLCKLAASKTTTVIMTIHQPRSDIFFMFDQTLVISKGEALYFGSTNGAAEYFNNRGLHCPSNYNIADYLLDIAMDPELLAKAKEFDGPGDGEKSGLSTAHQLHPESNNVVSRRAGSVQDQGNSRTEDADAGTTSPTSHTSNETAVNIDGGESAGHPLTSSACKPSSRPKTIYPTSFLTQLRVIMKRDFQTLIRDRSLLVLHLAVAIILGIFIGGLYFQVPTNLAGFQNRAGSLFFMLALLGFSSISALGAFTETRTLFVKERSNGYYPPMPFIISTLLFDLVPLRILPSLFLGCISYFMIGLSPVAQTFLKFLLTLVLFNVATALFCLVIAAGVRTTGIASLASSIVMLFMMLFGGFMINSGKIPAALTWIQYLSMFKYGFEALAVNEVATTTLSDNIQGVAFNVPGSLILQKLFGFDLGGYWRNMIIMVGFIILFITTFWSLVSLRLKERK
ncbi:hypothetical protein BGZ67_002753 [Mortierella alpina]|nr:hypothetical protein BGZ67_002753 [Mortierella alpina]